MELPRVDQPQAPDTVDKLLQGGKLSTAKKIQFLQAPVASLWTLFSFSIGKVPISGSTEQNCLSQFFF